MYVCMGENKIASQSHDSDHMIRSHDLHVPLYVSSFMLTIIYYGPTCTSRIIRISSQI